MNMQYVSTEFLQNRVKNIRIDLVNWINDDYQMTSHEGIGEISTQLVKLRLILDELHLRGDRETLAKGIDLPALAFHSKA